MKQYIELQVQGHTMRGYQQGSSDTCVVMFHGFTGSKTESRNLFKDIAEGLEQENISTLRFDYFGHGESDMNFTDIRVPLLEEQSKMIIQYAKDHFKNVYLLGFSMGGFFALDTVDNDIKKLFLLAPAAMMGTLEQEFFKDDSVTKELSGIILHRDFLKGFKQAEGIKNLKKYQNPIIILQGQDDTAVPLKNSVKLNNAFDNASIHVFAEADHCFEKVTYHTQLIDVIINEIK